MKYYEINTGIRTPASNEEHNLIEQIIEKGKIARSEMHERDQELAQKLVSRGLLERKFIDKKMYFVFNGLDDIFVQ